MIAEELQPGDVLIYSAPEDSWISKAIAFLTGSDVSHAALSYVDAGHTVEQSPPKARVRDARETFQGRTVYVMRHKGMTDLNPVVGAADRYVEVGEPYPMTNLYLLGLILIYQKFTPDTLARRSMVKVLKVATRQVIELINKRRFPGKLPMVCSQFVFQCFDDAGGDFRLAIRKGVLLKAALSRKQEMSCLERAMIQSSKVKTMPMMHKTAVRADDGVAESGEEIARQLFEALEGATARKTVEEDSAGEEELMAAVTDFSHALDLATRESAADLAESADLKWASARSGLQLLAHNEALFVTPADLLKNCGDLERIGVIKPSGRAAP
jgi:hypothetical protein